MKPISSQGGGESPFCGCKSIHKKVGMQVPQQLQALSLDCSHCPDFRRSRNFVKRAMTWRSTSKIVKIALKRVLNRALAPKEKASYALQSSSSKKVVPSKLETSKSLHDSLLGLVPSCKKPKIHYKRFLFQRRIFVCLKYPSLKAFFRLESGIANAKNYFYWRSKELPSKDKFLFYGGQRVHLQKLLQQLVYSPLQHRFQRRTSKRQ